MAIQDWVLNVLPAGATVIPLGAEFAYSLASNQHFESVMKTPGSNKSTATYTKHIRVYGLYVFHIIMWSQLPSLSLRLRKTSINACEIELERSWGINAFPVINQECCPGRKEEPC